MVRSPCSEKVGLKKGLWTAEEDQKLLAFIEEHGHGSWRALPARAGLHRCGKSCRLRWTNYLRPDIKRGKFSLQEEQTIIQLHALLGNRWSTMATHLPKRTDNEIKNYWNTHLKKRLTKMGIDPMTHRPKINTLNPGTTHAKDAANLSHMAQWESARLEAEARLVRDSKLLPPNPLNHPQNQLPPSLPPCLDILKAWQRANSLVGINIVPFSNDDLESPTSTLNFQRNDVVSLRKYYGNIENLSLPTQIPLVPTMTYKSGNSSWVGNENVMGGFSDGLATYNLTESKSNLHPDTNNNSDNGHASFEEYSNYWSNILNLVKTLPSSSIVF